MGRDVGRVYSKETLDKGTIHVPDGTELDGPRFHHALRMACDLKLVNRLFLRIFI